jgi:hypothetical protein
MRSVGRQREGSAQDLGRCADILDGPGKVIIECHEADDTALVILSGCWKRIGSRGARAEIEDACFKRRVLRGMSGTPGPPREAKQSSNDNILVWRSRTSPACGPRGLNGTWKIEMLQTSPRKARMMGTRLRNIPRPGGLGISVHPPLHERRQKRAYQAQQKADGNLSAVGEGGKLL